MVRRVRDMKISSTTMPIRPSPSGQANDETEAPNYILKADDPDSPSEGPKITIIRADLLIPGDGEPISNAALVVSDNTIVFVGPKADVPAKFVKASPKVYTVPVVMPGLWECHAHFLGSDVKYSNLHFLTQDPVSAGARLARGCWDVIQQGYTSVRDVGGYAPEVARAVNDGTIIGPYIYGAGAALSQTAGHGDIHQFPVGVVLNNLGVHETRQGFFGMTVTCICDGVDECRRAVRLQIRRGAKVIKVVASGGVGSRDDDPMNQQFSDEELKTIVEEAGRQDIVVAAHVHGKKGIMAAIKAGCKTLEHVSYADAEVMELMKEKGIVYIATREIIEDILRLKGKGIPPESWAKMQKIASFHLEAYKLAIKSGVTIALGTDTSPGTPAFGPFANELEYAVNAGMTPLEAIKAATANGPLSLGPQAPEKTGQLKEGYEADIIALAKNPLEDIKVLQKTKTITHVWKGGVVLKGPGVGPWGEEQNRDNE